MRTQFSILALAIVTIPMAAWAMPEQYSNCSTKINLASVDAEYFFDETCAKIYVLPPHLGSVRILDYEKSHQRSDICDMMSKLQEKMTGITKDISQTTKAVIVAGEITPAVVAERASLRTQLNDAQNEYATAAVLPGAKATYVVDTRQSHAVAALAVANPTIKVEAMPLSRSLLAFNEESNTNHAKNLKVMPAVLQHRQLGDRSFELELSNVGMCAVRDKLSLKAYIVVNHVYSFALKSQGKPTTVTRTGTFK